MNTTGKTVGLSPKLIPSIVAIIVGLVLVLVGEKDTGIPVILTGVGSLGAGAVFGPGNVVVPADDISDSTRTVR